MPVLKRGDHMKRAAVADMIAPDNGHRGTMQRLGKTPKNHMKDNARLVHDIQAKKRQELEEEARKHKELFKLSQFRDVESRVYEIEEKEDVKRHDNDFLPRGAAARRREELAEENRLKRSEVEKSLALARQMSDGNVSPRKASVPRADDVAALAPRSHANFISANRQNAVVAKRRTASHEKENGEARHESYGRVPDYLQERKADWAAIEEERRRQAPDPDCPRGMVRMSEEERTETLQVLRTSKEECMAQLQRLPFVIETPSLRKKQNDLESKLREIENAIAIFSRPKVYVAMN